jgi:hypothetical protein
MFFLILRYLHGMLKLNAYIIDRFCISVLLHVLTRRISETISINLTVVVIKSSCKALLILMNII